MRSSIARLVRPSSSLITDPAINDVEESQDDILIIIRSVQQMSIPANPNRTISGGKAGDPDFCARLGNKLFYLTKS